MNNYHIMKRFGLACVGLSMSATAWAGVPVIDFPNAATLILQSQNTLGQLVQLTELVKSTTSIASALASGDLGALGQLEGLLGEDFLQDYIKDFGIDFSSFDGVFGDIKWEDLKSMAKDARETYKNAEGAFKEGKKTLDSIRKLNGSSLLSQGTKLVKNTLFAKDSNDLVGTALNALKGRRQEAVKQASSAAYALALTAQQESAETPKEKLSENQKGGNKAKDVVAQIRNNTGALMSIATQLNMGNLLSASNLEVLATEAISTMAPSFLSKTDEDKKDENPDEES